MPVVGAAVVPVDHTVGKFGGLVVDVVDDASVDFGEQDSEQPEPVGRSLAIEKATGSEPLGFSLAEPVVVAAGIVAAGFQTVLAAGVAEQVVEDAFGSGFE